MNVFYDDLFCKENLEDIAFLQEKGYVIQQNNPIKRMSLDEIYANLFSYLDDYKNAGFKFINFPDELISISNDNHKFQCFGKSNSGYFVIDIDENIYFINNKYNSNDLVYEYYFPNIDSSQYDEKTINKYSSELNSGLIIQFVNDNLIDFVHSYNLFLSSIYKIKACFNRDEKPPFKAARLISNDLKNKLCKIDKNIVNEYVYWSGNIYEIKNISIPLNFQLAPYILTGRI